MDKKFVLWTACVIFALAGTLHLSRLFMNSSLIFGELSIPLWFSVVVGLIALWMSWHMGMIAKE